MKRNLTRIIRGGTDGDDGFVPGTPAERLAMVWPLTVEIASMDKSFDAEQRLQRDVTVLIRGKG